MKKALALIFVLVICIFTGVSVMAEESVKDSVITINPDASTDSVSTSVPERFYPEESSAESEADEGFLAGNGKWVLLAVSGAFFVAAFVMFIKTPAKPANAKTEEPKEEPKEEPTEEPKEE